MKTSKENAQDDSASATIPRPAAEQAKLLQTEEEHWETLLSLLAQSPVAVLPAAAPRQRGKSGEIPNAIASNPLLKTEPTAVPIKITRSTAEQYPLPSNVPSTRNAKRQTTPVAKPAAGQAKAEEIIPHPAEPRNAIVLPQRSSESWAGKLSQHIRSTFDVAHTSSASSIKPINKAEVAYNLAGQVDYVTYTINAPARKHRRKG